MRAASCLLGIVLVIIGGVSTAPAQPDFTPEALITKLLPQADPAWTPDARFGRAVAVDGDTAVFGAPWEEHSAFTKVGAVYVFTLVGADWLFQQRIIAPDPDQYHEFGHSVAISGDTIVIGADRDDDDADDAGAAYVFVRSGELWSLEQKLTPDEIFLNEDDLFGHAVAIDGDTVAVAAPGNNNSHLTDVGAVFVYTRSAGVWTEQQKLIHADPVASDLLGISLATDGDTLIAGASWKEVGGVPFAGAAYVFTRTAGVWIQQQKLTAPSGPAMEAFGSTLALRGDTAFIGVPVANLGLGREGAVDVFTRSGSTWTGHARLTASDAEEDDYFGTSLAFDADTVLIGAYGDDLATGNETGSAYVFTGAGAIWAEQAKLAASDAEGGDRFSWSVALEGDTAFIGAPNDDHDGGTMAGSGYVFGRSGATWTEETKIIAREADDVQVFGFSVAMSGDTILIGSIGDDLPTTIGPGSVSVFVNNGSTWTFQQLLTASDGQLGDTFGVSVAVSGDTAVVGAPNDDHSSVTDAGSAYVFTRSGGVWTEQQKLILDGWPISVMDRFAQSVSVDGDTIVIGAPGVPIAEVFTRSAGVWSMQQWLEQLPVGLEFGWSVSLSGDTAAVSDPYDGTGNVTVFERTGSTWSYQSNVFGDRPGSKFGHSVSLSGDTLAIGVPDGGVQPFGETWIFRRVASAWVLEQTLEPEGWSVFLPSEFGHAVAVDGDRLVVGDPQGNSLYGATQIFLREGTTWSALPPFTSPIADDPEQLGYAVAISGQDIVLGAPYNNHWEEPDVGAVYVLAQRFEVDLSITKDDGQTTALPGGHTTYTIVATNTAGPGDAFGATVLDVFPGELTCTWTCVPSGGANCTAGPVVGSINETIDLPLGGAATYTAVCDINPGATGSLVNTATVNLPAGMTDPNLSNNTATDINTLVAEADLAISKTNHRTEIVESLPTTYTIIAANAGPAGATGALVVDSFPPELTGCAWICTPAGGATCAPSGSTLIADNPSLPVGGTATYTATCTVAASGGTCSNTATISPPAGTTDPAAGNNSATDTDHVTAFADFIFADGFESGGTTLWDSAVPTLELAFVDLDRPTGDLELVFELENAVLRTLSPLVGPLVGGADADCEPVFEVSIRRQAGELELSARTRLDDGSWVSADWTTLPHHANDLRVAWRSALAGFADGHLDLTADDIPLIRLEHLANAGIALSRTGIGEDGSGRAALRLPR